MDQKIILKFGLILIFSLCLASCKFRADRKQELPNVIFVLADDLGWAELGCYGNKFNDTPNLDKLASQGVRFTNAYAAAPVCSPYRASLMSGQYPARIGITDYIRPDGTKHLPMEIVSLAEIFKSREYTTGIIGKWHLSGYEKHGVKEFGPDMHGFDETIMIENEGIGGGSYFYPYHFNKEIEKRIDGKEFLVDRVNLEAVEFIERHKDESFFLYFSHYAVHTRLLGKDEYVNIYRNKLGAGMHPETDTKARQNNPHLAAQLRSIDDGIGMIMDKLDELGLTENTILIFTSDNGGETRVTSNAPLREGKSTLYEGGIREPLIAKYPGKIPSGKICHEPTISCDFYPTFREILGLNKDPEQEIDGMSIWPLMKIPSNSLKRNTFFWHYPLEKSHFLGGRSSGAIREGDWKLIEFFDTGEIELYNLADDIGEQNNLAEEYPDIRQAMLGKLINWRKELGAQMNNEQ